MEAKQVIKDTLILNIKMLKRIPLVEAYKHLNQRKTSYKAHHPNRYSAVNTGGGSVGHIFSFSF